MRPVLKIMNEFLRFVFQIVCRINPKDFKKVPVDGPLILVGNHINFLEVPVFLPHIDHPNVIGIAKEKPGKTLCLTFSSTNGVLSPLTAVW